MLTAVVHIDKWFAGIKWRTRCNSEKLHKWIYLCKNKDARQKYLRYLQSSRKCRTSKWMTT